MWLLEKDISMDAFVFFVGCLKRTPKINHATILNLEHFIFIRKTTACLDYCTY